MLEKYDIETIDIENVEYEVADLKMYLTLIWKEIIKITLF